MNRIPVFVGVSLLVSLTLGHVALSNAQTPAVAPVGALALPRETAILAKLATNLEPHRCKPGDSVEAQTTEDIKQGKEVLLKKESVLLGHVSVVEPPSATQLETMVGIIFDGVKTKNGPGQSVHLLIRALAPEAEGPENSTL